MQSAGTGYSLIGLLVIILLVLMIFTSSGGPSPRLDERRKSRVVERFHSTRRGNIGLMFRIFDNEYRRVVGDEYETRDEAEERLAELIAADPSTEHALRVLVAGQGGTRKS